tara:strand:- start:904 stop:1188 length:285 start_codon:yes stop_codon:yes gene_type:complete
MNTEFINKTLNDLIQNLNQFKKKKFQSNLIKAADKAKSLGIKTISITGNNGGKLKKKTHMNINIDSNDTARIQECHLYIIHLLIELIEIENIND